MYVIKRLLFPVKHFVLAMEFYLSSYAIRNKKPMMLYNWQQLLVSYHISMKDLKKKYFMASYAQIKYTYNMYMIVIVYGSSFTMAHQPWIAPNKSTYVSWERVSKMTAEIRRLHPIKCFKVSRTNKTQKQQDLRHEGNEVDRE